MSLMLTENMHYRDITIFAEIYLWVHQRMYFDLIDRRYHSTQVKDAYTSALQHFEREASSPDACRVIS